MRVKLHHHCINSYISVIAKMEYLMLISCTKKIFIECQPLTRYYTNDHKMPERLEFIIAYFF